MNPARIRRLTNWALVVAAGASVVASVLTRNAWTSAERMVRETHLVVGFREAEIQRISVMSEGRQVVLARGSKEAPLADAPNDIDGAGESASAPQARWLFVEPYQGEAEEAAVDSLLRTVEFAAFTRKVDDTGFDRRAAGLDAPLVTIELSMGQVRTRLHVGSKAPAPANTRYIEVNGEGTANKGVYVVAESTAKELSVRPDAFVVRQIVPYGATSLATVTLRDAVGKQVRLGTGTQDDWLLEGSRPDGGASRLEPDAVARLFAALARSRAEQFLAGPVPVMAEPLGANVVTATFVPKTADKAPLTVRFGGPCPSDPSLSLAVRVSNPPLAACTVPLYLETFVTQLPELVDKRLFATELDSVEELSVQAGEHLLELARREDAWTLRKPEAGAVERDAGDGWVESLLAVQGQPVAQPGGDMQTLATLAVQRARVGTEPLREVVEVFGPSAQGEIRVDGSSLFAHRVSDDAWLELSAKHRGLFTPNALLLKSTQLLEAEVDHIKRVRVQTPSWTEEFEYRGTAEGCRLLAPAGQTADGALCLDVLDELRVLRAKRWVSANDEGTFGLATPTVRIEVALQNTSAGSSEAVSTRVLVVGSRAADGSYYAQFAPDPAVFAVRPSVVDSLTTLVLDRSPFTIDAQALESLVVRRSSAPELTLRRLGDELVTVGSADAPVNGLIDALALLRPEAAVQLLGTGQVANAPDDYGFRSPLLDVRGSTRTDGVAREFHWVVGRGGLYREVGIYYAMPIGAGPSAVFALPREAVQRILDAL